MRKPHAPFQGSASPGVCSGSSSSPGQLLLSKNFHSRPGSRQKPLERNSGFGCGCRYLILRLASSFGCHFVGSLRFEIVQLFAVIRASLSAVRIGGIWKDDFPESENQVVADIWETDVWDFQAKFGSSGSCPLFLRFLGKIAVQTMSGKTPGSPRHPSTRRPRPA